MNQYMYAKQRSRNVALMRTATKETSQICPNRHDRS